MDNLFDYSIGTGLTPGGNRYVYNHHTNQQFSAPADANIEQQHYWVRGFMAAIKKLEKSFEFYPERCVAKMHPDDSHVHQNVAPLKRLERTANVQ